VVRPANAGIGDATIVPPSDDSALIDLARRGDRDAFATLVRRHDRRVLRLALRLAGSEETARDIYQETFLRLYRSLASFRGECAVGTWIVRLASSVAIDHLRRAAARPEVPLGPPDGAGGTADRSATAGSAGGDPPDGRPEHDPERALLRREIGARIGAALARLAPRERLVFELRHEEGMRLREIAVALQTSEQTARNCLYRAHQGLRAALRDLRDTAGGARRGWREAPRPEVP
jgi:RNA polymerase sigma-70 factor, ECF subfamily